MLQADHVKNLMRNGMNFVCATCTVGWQSMEQKHSCPEYHKGSCGGPRALLPFPKYRGPFEGNLRNHCFVCGNPPSGGIVEIKNREKRISGFLGVCEAHLDLLTRLLNKANDVIVTHKPLIGGDNKKSESE